jgi:PAS domain S-box-containing protein
MIGTQSDIEPRKQVEEVLQQNEQYLRSIVEDQRELICRFKPGGKITFANQAFLNFTGLAQKEIEKKEGNFFSFILQNEETLARVFFDSTLAKVKINENELRLKRKDGALRNINWRCHWLQPSEFVEGEFQLVGQDITDIKKVLAQFHTRSTIDRIISEILARFTTYTGDDYREIINLSLQDLGEVLGMDRVSIFLFNFAQETMSNTHEWCRKGVTSFKENDQDQLLSRFPWAIDQLGVNKEISLTSLSELPEQAKNERQWLEKRKTQTLLMVPIELTNNRLIGFLSFESLSARGKWDDALISQLKLLTEVIANAIENKNAENLIRANETRERLFIDALPALIMRVDNAGLILDYISGCRGIFSQYISLAEPAPGTPLGTVFPNETAQALLASAAEYSNGETASAFEFEIEVAGNTAAVEARFAEIKEDEIMIILQDVSEKKKLEQQKTDFINNATHEMRTPLTTIMLMIDLLEKQNDFLKSQQYWDVLKGGWAARRC